eukprot:1720883-Rhodomonas_salina.2
MPGGRNLRRDWDHAEEAHVSTALSLCSRYAVSGPDIAYGDTRYATVEEQLHDQVNSALRRRVRCVPGTEIRLCCRCAAARPRLREQPKSLCSTSTSEHHPVPISTLILSFPFRTLETAQSMTLF